MYVVQHERRPRLSGPRSTYVLRQRLCVIHVRRVGQHSHPPLLLPRDWRDRGNCLPCAIVGLWCGNNVGSPGESLHPNNVRLLLRIMEGHVRCEPHLRVMRIERVEPGGVDGGLGVRLCRKLLPRFNCNPSLHAMRIDRRHEPSGLNERLGLCLRHRLYSRRGFDPTLRLAGELGESGCGWR